MINYIQELLPILKRYSASLNQKALFLNYSWVQLGNTTARTLFIFREKNGELLIVNNGDMKSHKWEHLAHQNAIIFDIDGIKSMFQLGFIDDDVLILVKDGTSEFLVLVNETKIHKQSLKGLSDRLTQKYINNTDKKSNFWESTEKSISNSETYCERCSHLIATGLIDRFKGKCKIHGTKTYTTFTCDSFTKS